MIIPEGQIKVIYWEALYAGKHNPNSYTKYQYIFSKITKYSFTVKKMINPMWPESQGLLRDPLSVPAFCQRCLVSQLPVQLWDPYVSILSNEIHKEACQGSPGNAFAPWWKESWWGALLLLGCTERRCVRMWCQEFAYAPATKGGRSRESQTCVNQTWYIHKWNIV